jgi:hypothetical protein
VNIQWVAHAELSAAHAAYIVATGRPCTDPKTEQLLVAPVTDINSRLLSASMDVGTFWQRYLHELLEDAEIRRACTVALMSSGCSELQVEQTAKAFSHRLTDARLAFMQRFPKLSEQLELRAKPLRDKWDTVGPGLLRDVGQQIWKDSPPDDWWASRVTALMIQPMRGGDGGYDSYNDKFWIEAMLTDVDPAVPEVLRVAWLITGMAIDRYTREKSGGHTLSTPWSLVSVPLVLSAAANLDLIDRDRLPIPRAMQLWQLSDAGVSEKLSRWWDDFKRSSTPLPAALKVLDKVLGASKTATAQRRDEY